MKRASWGAVEALAFFAAVMAYIWVFRFRAPWTVWLLVGWVAASCFWRGESLDSTGLSPRRFVETLIAWRWVWPAALLALFLTLEERLFEPRYLARGAAYFLWCTVQQVVYQNMVYRRLRTSLGAPRKAWPPAGLLFGLAHWPNPVLVPATALWGGVSSRLFERRPSASALALIQVVLSSLLYEATPWYWHHGFRVGPGYFWQ